MCWGHSIQTGMRPNKIKEKDKHENQVIGRSKRRKTLFSSVPCFELLVKTLDKIVRHIILEAFDLNMFRIVKNGFNRHFVGIITVRNDSGRFTVFACIIKHRNGLRGIAVR